MAKVEVMAHSAPENILYVENGIGYGGAIICLRHLVRNLDRNRYCPIIVTGRSTPEYAGIAEEALWRPITDRYVDVVPIRDRLAKSRWPDAIPGLKFLLSQLLARIDDLFNFLPFFLRLFCLAIRTKPILIHVNNEPLCNRAGIMVGKCLHIPVICHVRGVPEGSTSMAWFYRQVDHFIPVSRWISDGIGPLGIEENKRTVVYDGIELASLDLNASGSDFRDLHNIPRDAFAVGLVGLLIPWKGQRLFIQAAKNLRNRVADLKMVMVGGTPEECIGYEKELRAEVKLAGLDDVVVFTGHIADMQNAYNGLDIIVSASTSPEPLGTVVIECLAMRRPLVAPDHGGAAEMCDHDIDALLFKAGDAASLADEIYRLYQSEALRESLSMNAREKALKTFSVNIHAENVQRVYEQVLNRQGMDLIGVDGEGTL